MYMLPHGFWMWKNRGASPGYCTAQLGSFSVVSTHIPTIKQVQQAKQPSPLGRVAASLLKGSKWALSKSLPAWLSTYKHPVGFSSPATSFISCLCLLPPKHHLFLFQYCRCLTGTPGSVKAMEEASTRKPYTIHLWKGAKRISHYT